MSKIHLDPFEVEEFEDSEDGMITCPGCGHGTIVNLRIWREGAGAAKGNIGRPCTYCCRSGTVPKRVLKIPDQYPITLEFEKRGQRQHVMQVADNAEHEAQITADASEKHMTLVSREPMLA